MTPHSSGTGARTGARTGIHSGAPAADLTQAAAGAGLDQRTRIRIDLFLARRRTGAGAGAAALKLLALREHGREAGMNTAEMLANETGHSHEARASACLAFVAALLAQPGAPAPEALRRMGDAGYRPADIDEVVARVGRETA